ncbi:MAG: hypothetical protein AB7K86_19240 [Rhodospirillales bacterium]
MADGQGLTWNDGYYVEGYSNLGWILLIAAAAALGADPVAAARILGLVLTGAVVGAFVVIGRRRGGRSPAMPWLLALGASAHTLAIWAIGGLEQPLVLFCLFFGYLALAGWREARDHRRLWGASALFGVLALARLDGILFAGAFSLSILCFRLPWPHRLSAAARLAALPVAAAAAQVLFRLFYYGAAVPNTARVKLGFTPERVFAGIDYVGDGVLALAPLLAAAMACWLRAGKDRDDALRAGALATLAWVAYLVAIGGDIFPGFRHFTPVIAIVLVIIVRTQSAASAPGRAGRSTRIGWPSVRAAAALAVFFAAFQFAVPAHQRAKAERWEWDCRALAATLRDRFEDHEPVIAVTAAGCLPYWTEFESIDLLGLNDLELPNRRPDDFGAGSLGHELGDLDYLLERAPDIVVFHVGHAPNFAYRRQVAADPRFAQAYCAVTVDVDAVGERLVYLHRAFAEEVGAEDGCPAS